MLDHERQASHQHAKLTSGQMCSVILTKTFSSSPQSCRKQARSQFSVSQRVYQRHWSTEKAWDLLLFSASSLQDGQGFLISETSHIHSLVAPGAKALTLIYILRGQSLQSLWRRWWRVLVAKQMFCNAISQAKPYGGWESSKATRGWRTDVERQTQATRNYAYCVVSTCNTSITSNRVKTIKLANDHGVCVCFYWFLLLGVHMPMIKYVSIKPKKSR